jgi:hypothetical protein
MSALKRRGLPEDWASRDDTTKAFDVGYMAGWNDAVSSTDQKEPSLHERMDAAPAASTIFWKLGDKRFVKHDDGLWYFVPGAGFTNYWFLTQGHSSKIFSDYFELENK